MIKFQDLQLFNSQFEDEFMRVCQQFLHSGNYILGNQVDRFENSFATYTGAKYCIGTGTGLDALFLIFQGYKKLGKLKDGDEVVVPANTYIVWILAIIHAGLVPVFSEPNSHTFNISAKNIEINNLNNTFSVSLVGEFCIELSDVEIKTIFYNEQKIEDLIFSIRGISFGDILSGGGVSRTDMWDAELEDDIFPKINFEYVP